jgi:Outer membrane protein beta-barrel domain
LNREDDRGEEKLMRKFSLFLLALGFLSSHAFAQDKPADAQDNQASPATPSAGYILCPPVETNVFLYQSVSKFEVISSPRCGDPVTVLGRVDTMGGYLRVRTADGKEGYIPQDQVTTVAPAKSRIAIVEPPPVSVPAASSPILTGPLSNSSRSFGYDLPRVEAFGGYSYMNADWQAIAPRSGLQGWNGSAVVNVNPWLGVEGGMTGNYQSNCLNATGLTCSVLTVMGGPRITVHRSTNITAFAHGLVGIGSLTLSLSGSPLTNKDLAWAVGGGVDYAVTSRFSVRLGQVDLLRTQYLTSLGGTNQNNISFSAGVVIRIGKVISE